MKLSSLLLLTLPHLKHASETCEWSFTRAEELRVASVNAGTDRDPSVQDIVFQAFRDAIACDPNDGDSWVRLVFLSPYEADRAVLPHAPASYVSSHFDRLSESFDTLMETVEYTAATSLAALIQKFQPPNSAKGWGQVLDLGCGTGLLGQALADRFPVFEALKGVDLSSKMIQLAHDRGIYSSFAEAEVSLYVTAASESAEVFYDIIVMADVSGYLGKNLMHVVSKAVGCLVPRTGILALTLELSSNNIENFGSEETATAVAAGGWVLPRRSLRFAHHLDTFLSVCKRSGFEILAAEVAPLRMDSGVPVQGAFIIMQLVSSP